jgi:hypothetical protein
MTSQLQIDRQYTLIINQGKKDAVEINGLNISFTVSKNSNNKKKPNKANITIYNLSDKNQKYLEAPFVEVTLSVGYVGIGLQRLFSGQVTVAGTRKQGPDLLTEIQLDSLYTELNHKTISRTVPEGTSVKSTIETLVKDMQGVSRVVFFGKNIEKSFVDGYPLSGSPRQILNDISDAFQLEWQVSEGVLYILDAGVSYMTDTSKAFVISETTGLIERPYFDQIEKQRGKKDKLKVARNGVKLKILLNPSIIAGSIVKIEYGDKTGYYKVERLTHTGEYLGNNWETELVCGSILKG